MAHKRGIVYVITGDGKGKTTAALGLALRAIGHGQKVYFAQFMKGREYGEVKAAREFIPSLVIAQFGRDEFVKKGDADPIDIRLAQKGWHVVRQAIDTGQYDLVVLDEINVAVDFGLIPLEWVLDLIKSKPEGLDLVLTGRNAPPEVIALADTVSEVKEIKHHFRQGIKGRAGMEF
ncbi:MAG: cob(I)yrinic acid a,c-diamide adenosyltransferase [Syntrophales bacterium]|nr:cob(I)yrinic acid a,c-diamide adenosyltransferase [Syntrophales bacterium]